MTAYLITEGPNDGKKFNGVSRSHWNYVNHVQAAKMSRQDQIKRMEGAGYLCARGFRLSTSRAGVVGSELDVVFRLEDEL